MAIIPRYVVYAADWTLAAAVETSAIKGWSARWAAEYRCNILSHGLYVQPEYFVLATPERLFIWKDPGNKPDLLPPDWEIPAERLFAPYLQHIGCSPENVSRDVLHWMVRTWLEDLSEMGAPLPDGPEAHALKVIGFLQAVDDGWVEEPEACGPI